MSKTRHQGSEMLRAGGDDSLRLLMRRCLARANCANCAKTSADGWTATAEHGQPYYCEPCWKLYDQK